jgi:hypothetical protein
MANEGAAAGDDAGEDPLNFRPNPDALVSKVEEDAEEGGGGAGGVGKYLLLINRSTHHVKPFYLSSETVLPIE